MKKLTIFILITTILSSCVSNRETFSSANQSVNYNVKEVASSTVGAGRVWILFIPIGFGPRKYGDRRAKVIQRFSKKTNSDGVLNGSIVDRKIVIPLIVVTLSTHWTKLTGRPCVLKTDSLKK